MEPNFSTEVEKIDGMDSPFLNVLLQARASLTADGGSLLLRNPSTMARRILHTTGLQNLLDQARDDSTST